MTDILDNELPLSRRRMELAFEALIDAGTEGISISELLDLMVDSGMADEGERRAVTFTITNLRDQYHDDLINTVRGDDGVFRYRFVTSILEAEGARRVRGRRTHRAMVRLRHLLNVERRRFPDMTLEVSRAIRKMDQALIVAETELEELMAGNRW